MTFFAHRSLLLLLAAGAALAHVRLEAGGAHVDDAGAAALEQDDQCSPESGEDCALNALQFLGRRQEQEVSVEASDSANGLSEELAKLSSEEGAERPRSKVSGHDITQEVADELTGFVNTVGENATMMQWKLYYLKWDLMSLKGKVQNTPNHSIGVNGTEVDWNAHNASWIPTFAMLQESSLPKLESEEDLDLLEEASTSGRRRHGGSSLLLGVPPRTKKVAKSMTTQQAALDKVQSQLADFEREMNTLVNWMAHHDMALEQEEAVVSRGRSQKSGRRRRTTVAETGLHQPEEARKLLMEQIGAAWNQTADLWSKFKVMGDELQDVKERAAGDESLAQV